MPPSEFGRRLAAVRKLRDITQEQLAERSGVPAAVISHFETGVRASASADNLVKLADALRVSVDYLLARTNEIAPPPPENLQHLMSQLTEGQIEMLEAFTVSLARSKRDSQSKK